MRDLIQMLTALIALEHIGFLALEMFLWEKPLGRKVFRLSPAQAKATATLAANQGLYNGFLAAGLLWSLLDGDRLQAHAVGLFFSACVLAAGLYGGYSVSRRIYLVQALPALLLLVLRLL